MSLQKRVPCRHHNEGLDDPRWAVKPTKCLHCGGSGFEDVMVKLPESYRGNFREFATQEHFIGAWVKNNWFHDDYDVKTYVDCICGDRNYLHDNEPVVCKCGRIYKMVRRFEVDESHIDDKDLLIQESNRDATQ